MANTNSTTHWFIAVVDENDRLKAEAAERDAEIVTLMSDLADTQDKLEKAMQQLEEGHGRELRNPMDRTRATDPGWSRTDG